MLWRSRGLWLGGLALGLALYGQKLIVVARLIDLATRWYVTAIPLSIVAWHGTYKNRSLLLLPRCLAAAARTIVVRPTECGWQPSFPIVFWQAVIARCPALALAPRYAVAFSAVGLYLVSIGHLRANGHDSATAGFVWLASLLILLVAFLGHRLEPVASADINVADVEDKTDVRLPQVLETGIVLAIFSLALSLHSYRQGDWTSGVHGDEGEAGSAIGQFTTPEDVAPSPDGKVYVLDSSTLRIQVFTLGGKLDRIIDGVGSWRTPAGFTVGPDGGVYLADTCNSRVLCYTPSGEVQGELRGGSDPTTRLEQSVDVAVGERGRFTRLTCASGSWSPIRPRA